MSLTLAERVSAIAPSATLAMAGAAKRLKAEGVDVLDFALERPCAVRVSECQVRSGELQACLDPEPRDRVAQVRAQAHGSDQQLACCCRLASCQCEPRIGGHQKRRRQIFLDRLVVEEISRLS